MTRIPIGLVCILIMSKAYSVEGSIALPDSARVFSVGEKIVLNGVPMHMRGFRSSESVDDLLAWFSRELGSPLVENHLGKTTVLGKAVGHRYLSVQLERDANGVRGVVTESDFEAAAEMRPRRQEQLDRWLLGLPSGSAVRSDMVSADRGRHAWHAVFENTVDAQINSERTQALMAAEGFVLENESSAADMPGGLSWRLGQGRTLYFKGAGKEAIVTISRDTQRRTTIVINTVSTLGRLP